MTEQSQSSDHSVPMPVFQSPPIGEPIPLQSESSTGDDRDSGQRNGQPSGEHVVVIAQTAGTRGAAHTENTTQEG